MSGLPHGALPPCALLLLAGGQSRRLGRDKARLRHGGRLLMAELAARFAPVCGEVIICTGSAENATDTSAVPGAAPVPDARPGMGPLAGMAAGLAHMRAAWAFVLACDMPRVPPALPAQLLAAATAAPPGKAPLAVVPAHGGKIEPLCALYHKAALPAVEAQLAAGQPRVRALYDKVPTLYVETEDCFFNINTPGDLAQFEGEASGG